MNDRHLDVIERSTMDNTCDESALIYTFEDKETEIVFHSTFEKEKELRKIHGTIVDVKRVGSI